MSDVPSDHPLQAWLAATRGGSAGEADTASAPDQQPPVPPGAVSKRLLAATAGVCLAAVTLGVTATGLGKGPATRDAAVGAAAPAPAAILPTTATAATASDAPATPVPVDAPADPAITAAAVIAVRSATPPDLYVDTAVVDEVTVLEGLVLVSVRAVVVPRVDGRWRAPATVRYAVPVGTADGSPAALGDPWRLPAPKPREAGDEPTPVPDPDLARTATDAVAAAGYRQVTDVTLSRPAGVPNVLIAALQGIAPGDAIPRPATVWLTADALRVLGAPNTVDLPVPREEP